MGSAQSLLEAARSGSERRVRRLAERGDVAVDGRDARGQTPLMLAAARGDVVVVRVLLDAGADVDAVQAAGMTPLMYAVRYARLPVARCLLDAGANVNAAAADGTTALLLAVALSGWRQSSNAEFVGLLLGKGANTNAVRGDGASVLVSAEKYADTEVVQLLVDAGTVPDRATERPMGPMQPALMPTDQDEVLFPGMAAARMLPGFTVDHDGGMVRYSPEASDVTLSSTAERSATARPDSLGKAMPLLVQAAKNGEVDQVRKLVEEGRDVNEADKDGMTALMYAAKEVQLEIVELLLANGADVNLTNRLGQSAIYFAKRCSNTPIVELLIKRLKRAKSASEASNSVVKIEAQELTTAAKQDITPRYTRQSWFIPLHEVALQTLGTTKDTDEEYRGTWLDADVMVKLFIPGATGSTFGEEVTTWHQLRHPNVIKLYGACNVGLHFFVCELAPNGSLADYLSAARGDADTQPGNMWKFLHEAALGLAYLHERKIFHGNLRCRNILVGADGLAKLTNFELSGSMRSSTAGIHFKSIRWQSPERFKGEKASFSSDIYSLGLCVFEAVTGVAPWGRYAADDVYTVKALWDPSSQTDENGPGQLTAEVHEVLTQMCSRDPHERISAASAAHLFKRFAASEAAKHELQQPEPEDPLLSLAEFRGGDLLVKRTAIRDAISQPDRNNLHQCLSDEIEELFKHLEESKHRLTLLESFDGLVGDFVVAVYAGSHENRILRLSSTRATSSNMQIIRQRVEELWDTLGDHQHCGIGPKRQWEAHRMQLMGVFVSEVSETMLVLNNVDEEDDGIALFALLKGEIDAHGFEYSENQLMVLQNACEKITQKLDLGELSAPAWFLPWYELVVNNASCVGKGGFGSVYRAKWLDSEVVVKQVKTLTERNLLDCSFDSLASVSISTVKAPVDAGANRAKREEMRQMFVREVAVWFGLSHPHVVRLFGACHIGIPFFACEYAGNGSLDKYLRKHLDEMWQKLYEASLGVQYLHARGIVHGDLKCNNIVVGSDGKAKVTDFGLSSEAALSGDHEVQLSGAWQWVAPECLEKGPSQRSPASDIYALGMCIIEALRIVELIELGRNRREFFPTPWGNLDNASVKYHVVQLRKLPLRPELCSDEQWALVERMCANDPKERMRITTVVGELARFAGVFSANDTSQPSTRNDMPSSLSDTVADMKASISAPFDSEPSDAEVLRLIYQLLWERLEGPARFGDIAAGFLSNGLDVVLRLQKLVESAMSATLALHELPDTLIAFSVNALRGCAFHRELDKLIDADFFTSIRDEDAVHDWKARCYEFMGAPGA